MGNEDVFKKVKLFSGIIYRDNDLYLQVRRQLEEAYSVVDLEAGPFDFDFTTYYNNEMGTPLFRRFVAFKEHIPPEMLPDVKLLTNRIEQETAINGGRAINLDPGYLSDANVIIATTKNYYHRIPLAKGIYAHMEYVFKGKKITFQEWTYPDFKSPRYLAFFENLLPLYKKQVKESRE